MHFAKVMAVFFFLSCTGLAPVAWQANRDYRVARAYLESEAEIIEFIPVNSGYDTRPGEKVDRSTRPSFVFRFATKEGQTITTRGYDAYGGREAPPSEWSTISAGDRVPCWYDPKDPKKAVLSRRFNPSYYWLLAIVLGAMVFTGLILRECFRRALPPSLKGIETGHRLAWRLPVVASQGAMTGCLGIAVVLTALLTAGFVFSALDYDVVAYRFRWLSRVLGFNMNGWWIVALVSLLVTLLFLWAFFYNLRWVMVPEPVVEVSATNLRPGGSSNIHITQRGPLKASTYTVSLICEINGIPGKPPAIRKEFISSANIEIATAQEFEAREWAAEFNIPSAAALTCKSVPLKSKDENQGKDLVSWFIRVERRVSAKNVLQSDFEVLVTRDP
jgi:hypothetical protein